MRVVLDTYVLVSGIFFAGIPGRILGAWSDGKFDLVATAEIVSEYRGVVGRLQASFPSVNADPTLDLVVRGCHLVEAIPVPPSACEDPDDVKFLSAALGGLADCVVSGDGALLRASGFSGVVVLKPREFVRRFLER